MTFARRCIRVADRTISLHLRQGRLHRAALAGQPGAFGRFEAERSNELWISNVLVCRSWRSRAPRAVATSARRVSAG
jgi:hypothetical protein